jgi:hypothetical protein
MDRDQYVHFECENLYNYAHYRDLIQAKPKFPHDTVELACVDANVAWRYGWHSASAYSQAYVIDPIEHVSFSG